MKFNNEEISDLTGTEFSAFFKKKYPNLKIMSLNFGIEFYFNNDEDDILNINENTNKTVHINCTSAFEDSEDFAMDFRAFSGKNFEECFKKFKVYFDGLYKVYLIEKKNNKNE